MTARLKALLGRPVIAVLRRLGYAFVSRSSLEAGGRDLPSYLASLVASGVSITTVYDIGAYIGEWTREVSASLPAGTRFVLFEPNEAHRPKLDRLGHTVLSCLLSDTSGPVPFYSSGGTGDSIYRENSSHYDGVEPEIRDATTLDEVVVASDLPPPDLIKIDTQGAELAVLRGAVAALTSASLLYLEMPVLSYNVGAPSFDEYVSALGSAGFVPIGLFGASTGCGVLIQVDMLFMSTVLHQRLHGSADSEWAKRLIRP